MKCISCGMRLTGLLLTFVLILSLFAAGTASADAALEMGCGIAEQTVTIVEPKLVQRRGGIDDSEYHTDAQTAGEELRGYLKNHEDGSVKFKYSCDTDFGDVVRAIYSAAVAHTGDPQEGDAIRWATNGYHAGASGYTDYEYNYYTISFDVGYYTTPEQEAELTAAVDALIEQFDFDWDADEFEKVKTVYDYVCGHVEYDYANLENSGYTLKYTAYAAMLNGTSVCQGYALLMYRLLLEVGVDCRLISGTGNGGGHAWNIVKLGDRYYNIDSTWDAVRDPYEYYLRSDGEFDDHTRAGEYLSAEFAAAYPMSRCSYPHPYANGTCTACGEADPNYVSVVYGDANGDGEVNGKDLLMLRRYMANYDDESKTSTINVQAGADANGDGEVNGKDLLMLRRYMANYDDDTRTSTVVLGPR